MEQISFGTDGWRATLDVFTAERVRAVGQAVATYLTDEGMDAPVVVGYDAREHSQEFAEALAGVLCTNGFDVLLPRRDRPTPLIAHAIVDRGLAGGLVVTASHNPPEYNGVKFIPADGTPALPTVTDAIDRRLAPPTGLPSDQHGSVHEVDLREPHASAAMDLVDSVARTVDLADVHVGYDAMHGSGRGTTDALLADAGATVTRLRCDRDPTFGGGSPNPTPGNLSELTSLVRNGTVDLGIANDGDADRLAVVTPRRGPLDENAFFAALYEFLLETDAGPVVRTVSTTYLLDRIADAHGETAHEVPVGFKWVAKAMADHDALVGGEESGGFTVRGHVREKDGVLVALLATVMHAREPIDDRVDRLLETYGPVVQGKRSVACPDAEKEPVLTALEETLPDTVAGVAVDRVNTADGFKLLLADGSWLLVRPSGTEPVLRVYGEAETDVRLDALLDAGEALLEPHL